MATTIVRLFVLHLCLISVGIALFQVLLDTPEFLKRFAIAWGGFFLLISGPISAQTFDPANHVSL